VTAVACSLALGCPPALLTADELIVTYDRQFGNDVLTLGGDTITSDSGVARNLANDLVFDGDVTFGQFPGGLGTLNFYGDGDLGGAVRTLGIVNGRTAFWGDLTGSGGGLIKTGTGTLVLAGNNTFDAGVTLQQGVTLVRGNNALGSGLLTMSGGATLASLDASTITLANDILLSGTAVFGRTFGSTGAFVLQGNVSIGSSSNRNITIASDVTINGIISSGGTNNSISKMGFGTLTLTNENTYTGETRIQAGTLRLGGATGNVIPDGSRVTINGGATFDLAGLTETIGSLTNNGTVDVGGGSLTFGGSVNSSGGGLFVGTGSVIKVGTGTWTPTGASTFTGSVTLREGLVNVGSLNNIGEAGVLGAGDATSAATNAASLVLDGATLRYTGPSIVTDRSFTLGAGGGTILNEGSGALMLTGPAAGYVGDGPRTLTLGGTYLGNTALTSIGSSTLGIVIGDGTGGPTSLVKTDSGVWHLTGTNTYTGATSILGGTLVVTTLANGGSNSNIGRASTAAGNLIIDGGTLRKANGSNSSTNRLFTVGVGGATFDSSASSGSVNMRFSGTGAMGILGTGTRTIYLTGTNNNTSPTTNNIMSVDLVDDGFNATSLWKKGTGSWVISRNGAAAGNSYTGTTTIERGTLILNFNTSTGPVADLIRSVSPLVMRGGSLITVSKADNFNSQGFGSLTLAYGASTISTTSTGTGGVSYFFGELLRSAGATVDFNFSADSNANTITPNAGGTGILGAFATVAGANWATAVGGNIEAFTGYVDVGLGGSLVDGPNNNVRINAGTSGNITLGGPTVSINTLLQDHTTAATVDLAGGLLRFGGVGGIMIAAGREDLTIGTAANSGSVTAGGLADVPGDLILTVVDAADNLTMNAAIVDNGFFAPVSLTKSGAGIVTLNGTNTYTGGTFLNQGTIRIAGPTALGTGLITVNGSAILASTGTGRHVLENAFTLQGDLQIGDAVGTGTLTLRGNFDLAGDRRTLSSPNGYMVVEGQVFNGGVLKAGGNILSLMNKYNAYDGGTYLTAGTLEIAGPGSLGTGPLYFMGASSTYGYFGYALGHFGPLDVPVYVSGNMGLGRGDIIDSVNLAGSVDLLNGVRNIAVNNYAHMISGVISNGGITKVGAGELQLTSVNTYSLGTNVSRGWLSPTVPGALGQDVASNNVTVRPTSTASIAVLRLLSPEHFGANQTLSITPNLTTSAAAIALGPGFAAGTGNSIAFNTTGTGLQNIRITDSATNIAAILLDGIRFDEDIIAKTNLAAPTTQVWLGATHNGGRYTGTSLSSGVGATYRFGGGSGTLIIENANVLTGNNNLVVGSNDATSRNLLGTLLLAQTQSFTGNITIGNGGALAVAQDAALGDAANDITMFGGVLEFRATGAHGNIDTQYAQRDVTVNATATIVLAPYGGLQQATVKVGGLHTTGGARTVVLTVANTSNLEFSAPSTFTGTGSAFTVSLAPNVNNLNYTTFSAPISDANGAATLRLAGSQSPPAVVLSADNTYSGTTQVTRGTLVLAHTGAAGNPGSGINMNPASSTTATLDLRTNAVGTSASPVVFDFGTLSLAGTGTRVLNVDRVSGLGSGAVIAFDSLETGTAPDLLITGERGYSLKILSGVTLGANFTFNVRGTTLEIAGGVTDGAGSFNLVKTGTGTMILSGAASYNGNTTVNQGTLIAAHDTAGLSDVFGTGNLAFGSNQNSGILLSGARTLDKAITNSATGGIQVLGGLDAGDKVFAGNIAVGRGITFTASTDGDVTVTGALSGTGGITIGSTVSGVLPANGGTPPLGRGTVILDPTSGSNTFTGGVTINSGALIAQAQASASSALGTNNAIALNDGTFILRGVAGPTADSLTITTAGMSVGGGANLRIHDLAVDGQRTIMQVDTITRTGTGAVAFIPELNTGEEVLRITTPTLVNGILAPWLVKTVSQADRSGDFVTVNGSGDVVGATYTSLNVDDAANTSASIVSSAGGALTADRFAYALKLGANLDLAGFSLNIGELTAGTFGGLILNNGANVENGTLNFGTGEGLIYVDDASTSRISASITGNGAVSLTKFGAGTLILSGSNTYRGDTIINRGTLRMDVVNGIGGFTRPVGFSRVTVGAAAVFDLNSFDTEIGALTGDFGAQVLLGSAKLTVGRSNTATTFSGRFVGDASSILVKAGTSRLILDNTRGDLPSTLGELRVNQGQVRIVVTGNSNGSPYEVGNSLGPDTNIVLRGGTVEFYTSGDNTSSQQVLVAGNSITVDGANGGLATDRFNSADSNKLVLFNNLTLGRNSFATTGANANMPKFLGTTTLLDHAYVNVSSAELTLDGQVTDGAGFFTLNKVGGSVLNLNSTLNDWQGGLVITGGTVLFGARGGDAIYSPGNTFNPNSLATAGTGSIIVNNGSAIRFNDATNLSAGQTAWVIGSSSAAVALVDIRTDRTIDDYDIRSIHSGALAIGSGGTGATSAIGLFSEVLDMSRLGDGTWGLSASQDTVYTAETLGVGVGDQYRFFGNTGGNFIIVNRNVLTGTASLSVGRSLQSLGAAASNTGAIVRLLADQDYTGDTILYRTAIRGSHGARLDVRGDLATGRIENYGRFELNGNGRLTNDLGQQVNEYYARPGSSLRLDYDTGGAGFLFPGGGADGANYSGMANKWQDDLEMFLNGSQLNLVNASAVQSVEQIGSIRYAGGSEVYLERRSTDGQPILIVNGPLTRVDFATLGIRINVDNELGGLGMVTPGVGSGVRFKFSDASFAPQRGIVADGSAAGTVVNMVAPQFVEQRQMFFVDYNPDNIFGFTSVQGTAVNSAAFNNGGLNNGTEIIHHATTAVTSVAAGVDVWALRTAVGIAGANPIQIRSGGLIASGSSMTISAPLVFSNGGKVEADIWTNVSTNTLTLSGPITAENMTKNGIGNLVLSGDNTNLTGTLQLNGGTVQIRGGNLGAGGLTTVRLHGAYLNNDGSFEMPRLDLRANTGDVASQTFNLDVIVSAEMPFAEILNDRWTGTATNRTNTINSLIVEGGGAAGTVVSFLNGNDFDFTVLGGTTLGLFDTSPVTINVINNSSTNRVTFEGVVSGISGITKTGNGILRLSNINNEYFGNTVLNDGTLELLNATATTDTRLLGYGTLELNRGSITFFSNTTNTNFLNSNDVNVNGQVQLTFARQSGTTPVVVHQMGYDNAVLRFSGSGVLQINSTSNGATPVWNGSTVVTGNQTINVNTSSTIGLTLGNNSDVDAVTGDGRIVKTGFGQLIFNTGNANTFTGGLDIMAGRVKVLTPDDTLGLGAIRMSPGAILDILVPGNITGAGITQFAANSAHNTTIILGTNTGTGFTTIAQVNALLQSGAYQGPANDGGLLAGGLNAGNFNFLADQSSIGNGYWFLGAVVSNTTFTNVTFTPGAGNVFRLGGGGAVFYMNPSTTGFDVLKDVVVEGVGTRLLVGKPHASLGNGSVVIDNQANNSYSGGTTVSRVRDSAGNFTVPTLRVQGGWTTTPLGSGVVEVYGNLQFESSGGSALRSTTGLHQNVFSFHAGSRLIFENGTPYSATANTQGRWGDNVAIALRSSSVEQIGDATASVYNSETVGAVSFSGNGELRAVRASGFSAELIVNGALTRIGNSTLTLAHTNGLLGINDGAVNVERIKVVDMTGHVGANGMVNPYMMSRTQSQFLRYDPALGFQTVDSLTPHADYVLTSATVLDGSVSSKLLDGTAILSYDNAAVATLGQNLDVYALRINGTINSSADLTATQITVRSGGVAIYSPDPQSINADLVFGTLASPGEALLFAASDTLTIDGKLTASNITKYGTGFVSLLQDQSHFTGQWNLNQGALQILSPAGLGSGEVFLNGWTGNATQSQMELRLNFNPLTPDELVFTSGKITVRDSVLIRIASASDRNTRISDIDLTTTAAADSTLAIPGVLRFQVDGARSMGRTGVMTMYDHYLLQVDAGSYGGAGATTSLAPDSINNQGLYDLSKIGDGVLQLGDNLSFTGGRTVTVSEGAVRVSHVNAFGSAGANTNVVIEHGGALEIAVAGFAGPPGGTLTLLPGAIERWAVDGARPTGYNLDPGAHLQIFASQTGTATYGLNGGSLMGYLPVDYDQIAIINSVGANVSFNLLADSFLGQPYAAGQHNTSNTFNHFYYDMGKANLLNNPLDPRLQGGYLQVWGNITGAFSLTKVGQDVVLLGGVNDFAALNVNEGIVQLGSETGLAPTTLLSLTTDGLFDLNGFSVTVAGLSGGSAQSRIVNGATTIDRLIIDTMLDQTYAGQIYTGVSVVKRGTGTLTLTGPNDYVAPTVIEGGILAVSSLADGGQVSGIGSSSSAAANLVLNGGTLAYVGPYGQTDRRLTIGPAGAGFAAETGALVFTNQDAVVYEGAGLRSLTFTGANLDNSTFYLDIGDAGGDAVSVVKSGPGVWYLSGQNTYTGGTHVTGGTLRAGTITALPTGGDVVIAPADAAGTATLDLNNAPTTLGNIRFAGAADSTAVLTSGIGILTLLGDVTYDAADGAGQARLSGTLLLGGVDSRVFDIADGAAATDFLLDAAIADAGNGLTKRGLGTLELTQTNFYRGVTTLEAGVVSIGEAAALGDGSATNGLAFNGGTLRSTGSFALGAARTIDMQSAGGTFDVIAGNVLVVDGATTGVGAMHKSGAGTLALQTPAAHAGGTFVDQGTLVLRSGGNLTGAGTVNVAATATLAGSAVISGTVDVAGTISPGTNAAGDGPGIGTLTFASTGTSLLLQGGSTWEFQFSQNSAGSGGAGTDWDFLDLAGSLAFTATTESRINFAIQSMFDGSTPGLNDAASTNPFDPAGIGYSWLIADADAGFDLSGSGISDPSQLNDLFAFDTTGVFGAGLYAPVEGNSFWISSAGTSLYLNYGAVAAVPEPGSLAMVGVALAGFLAHRRRKNRKSAAEQSADATEVATIG
jgi:autotransporter-associated beta strand protein